jgi:hypothetical protein
MHERPSPSGRAPAESEAFARAHTGLGIMNGQLTSFLRMFEPAGGHASFGMILIALLFAFVMGQVVAWIYTWTHTGISYSRAFVHSLVMIAVIIALIMVIVGQNVIVAFGMFGAFAVIRFRNVLKDTRDTGFIFMELAVGLGAGTGNFLIVAVGTVFFGLMMLYLKATGFGSIHVHDALLRFEAPHGLDTTLRGVLLRHCQRIALVSHRADSATAVNDYSYRLLLRDPLRSSELIHELNELQGVGRVSLLLQEYHSEI